MDKNRKTIRVERVNDSTMTNAQAVLNTLTEIGAKRHQIQQLEMAVKDLQHDIIEAVRRDMELAHVCLKVDERALRRFLNPGERR